MGYHDTGWRPHGSTRRRIITHGELQIQVIYSKYRREGYTLLHIGGAAISCNFEVDGTLDAKSVVDAYLDFMTKRLISDATTLRRMYEERFQEQVDE